MHGKGTGMSSYYEDHQLKKVQAAELLILREFDRICGELGIEYFAEAGTELGAVRHGGFIPWDDDVDVAMDRAGYERFLREAPALLPPELSLQTPYNDPNCPYYFSKLRLNGTVFMEYCNRNVDMHQGIYIDIYPFDEIPDDEALNLRQYKAFQRWTRIFTLRQSPDVSREPRNPREKARAALRRVLHGAARILPAKFIVGKMDHISKKYNGTGQSRMTTLTSPVHGWDYVRLDAYRPLLKMPFEDMEISVLRDYDANLTSLYGDYMQPPPPEKRKGHRPYRLDFGDEDG